MEDKELIRIQRDLAVALNGESDLHAALTLCLATALEVSGMDGGGIYLLDSGGGLDLAVSQGLSTAFTETVSRLECDSPHVEIVREGTPLYVHTEDLPDVIRDRCLGEGLKGLAVLPICHMDESIACMNLASREFCELPESIRCQLEGISAILGGAIARLQAEATCRQSGQTLAALLDASTESAFLVDLDGVVLAANQTLAERLNTTVREVVGRSIADFVPPKVAAQARTHYENVIETGEPESRVQEWNGRWFQRSIQPIYDETGKVVLLAGFSAEITARRRAEQKIQAEQRLLRELLDLQERERKLISHELHDGFVQDIVGAQMLLDAALSQADAIGPVLLDRLNAAQMLLRDAIVEARRMIRDLRPVIIRDDSGVVGALLDMVAQEEKAGEMQLRFEHDVRFQRLDPMLEGTIFRIVHEALVNVRKHSGTTAATVRLTEPNDLLLEIEDQGNGFDPAQVPPDRFGVRGIQERARLFGGQATIESRLGAGTKITVVLPVRDPKFTSRWIRELSDDRSAQPTTTRENTNSETL
jgi:PAS domain S-box-containing protein